MLGFLNGIPGKLKSISDSLTSNFSALTTAVNSMAPASTALTNAIWTNTRANYLDYLLISQTLPKTKVKIFTTNGTFTAPYTGWYRFYALGAGGSGGMAFTGGAYTNHGASASGGGGGALSIIDKLLTAGDVCTITVGVGGTRVTMAALLTPQAVVGNAGTLSRVVGPSTAWTITANGGNGGTAASSTNSSVSTTAISVATASGGDHNISGGISGIASATANGNGPVCASTGGAAPATIFRTGVNSTNISATYTQGISAAGGGAGCATSNSANNGGSNEDPGSSLLNTTAISSILNPLFVLYGVTNGIGGGGNIAGNATAGGLFAGGGSLANSQYSVSYIAGNGGIGAGGGGASTAPNYAIQSGAGGNGLVLVEF